MVNGEVFFEKKIKNYFKTIIYDLDGFNQDGPDGIGLNRKGFNINGIDERGFIRNKKIVCGEKVKQAIKENPWNICYASDVFKNNFEIMKECVELEPNTYQYATLHLKQIIDLAMFSLKRGGSFSLIINHLRNNKKVGKTAVKINPNSSQYVGKILKDDDDIFKLTFQENEKIHRYASERLRKLNI